MRATGDGAEAAIEALIQLVERDFDETDVVSGTGAVRGATSD